MSIPERLTRKALEFSHNVLNLPMTASSLAGSTVTNTMTYTYLGDGTRVGARVSNPDAQGYSGMRYRGSFVYDVTADGVHSLQSVAVSTGRLIALTGTNGTISFESDGFITDHVGNVRSVVWLNAPAGTSVSASILEQNDYLPFGTRLPGSRTDQSNRYRLGGKEEQDIAGMDLSLLDFGARYYDAFVGRWNAIDPLAHKYFGMSPYNYCGNDPVNFFDPDGEGPITGALIGGGASYFGQVGANWVTRKVNNLSVKEILLTKVDFFDVLVSAGEGALTSGASALKKVAIGTVSGAVQGAINISCSSGVEVTGVAETAVGAAIGAVSAAIPESENNQKPFNTTKSESNNKVVAAARQKAAENGESLSPQQYNDLRKANNETIKNAQEKNKAFWNSTFDSIKGAAQSLISTLFGHED